MRKILATVVSTLKIFFQEKPYETVRIDGSDQVRRTYYHKLVVDYSNLIEEFYIVRGRSSGKIERFTKGKNYEFILISLREIIPLVEEKVYVMATKKSVRDQELEKQFLKYVSNKKAEDILPEKHKRAWESLRKAGLIKD